MASSPLLSPSILAQLRDLVGAPHVLTQDDDLAAYNEEWRRLTPGCARVVVRPGSTAEVSATLALCHHHKIAVVPQGGNTGLVGGQVALEEDTLLVSLSRMKRIRHMDAPGYTMIAEAGLTVHEAQEAAAAQGRLFALALASEGSCQIGGTVSTNAGGMNALLYGTMRTQVLGLEAVLADGRVWNGLRTVRKDNSGYDLKQIFIGAEGTLGIVTAAALKLYPLPEVVETAFLATADEDSMLALVTLLQDRFALHMARCELVPEPGLQLVLNNVPGSRRPLQTTAPWYVAIELVGGRGAALRDALQTVLEEALEQGLIVDGVLAETGQQRNDIWHVREALSDAQKPEGGCIKLDVSVPLAAIPAFLRSCAAWLERHAPGSRPIAFGHLGDGNIHYDICQPLGDSKAGFLARWEEISGGLHEIVLSLGGSVAAEHGVGTLKRGLLERTKQPLELELMRCLKTALDPLHLLNPGKVLRAP